MATIDPKTETEKLMELVSLLEKNRRWYHKGAGVVATFFWSAWTIGLFSVFLGWVEINQINGIILFVLFLMGLFGSTLASTEKGKMK